MQLIDVYKVTVLISVLADIAPAFLYHWVIHGTQLPNHYHLFVRLYNSMYICIDTTLEERDSKVRQEH